MSARLRSRWRPRPQQSSPGHREAAQRHTLRRLLQRFDIALGRPDLMHYEQQIRDGHADLVEQLKGARRACRMTIRGQLMVAVFDDVLDCIVTVLPIGWRLR
jgi:hypothetical protein